MIRFAKLRETDVCTIQHLHDWWVLFMSSSAMGPCHQFIERKLETQKKSGMFGASQRMFLVKNSFRSYTFPVKEASFHDKRWVVSCIIWVFILPVKWSLIFAGSLCIPLIKSFFYSLPTLSSHSSPSPVLVPFPREIYPPPPQPLPPPPPAPPVHHSIHSLCEL